MQIAWLEDPACQDAACAGGKAANLSRAAAAHPVPPGFCLTVEAYCRWVQEGNPPEVPSDVRASLQEAYDTLRREGPTRVAVRSSAVGEDGRDSSFAGQYLSYLNAAGFDEVADAVVRCWESARGERVLAYRQRGGGEGDAVAVLVQRLIVADVAFVAFSADPVAHRQGVVVVNSNWGLGESIVEGTVAPDSFVVRKSDGAVLEANVSDKQVMTVVRPTGVAEVRVPRALRLRRTLSDAEVGAVARLATRLEEETGCPVDIEGAYEDGELYLLQWRPVTTS